MFRKLTLIALAVVVMLALGWYALQPPVRSIITHEGSTLISGK